jgi:LmbE family N-acetylglucosaminyl deacetylase
MRWIYLSPHLDDAVLSAGGLLHDLTQSGTSVEIWTFMCGDPQLERCSAFADDLHKKWGFANAAETVRARRVEDHAAASVVGAKAVHFDFLDCIYRRDQNGDWLYSEISVPPREADADYPARIAASISARLEPDDVLVCQLAVGSHVDHVLVRRAAELLRRPLRYVVDVPYIFYKPHEFSPKAAGMEESVQEISKPSLNRWVEAALVYQSQFAVLGDKFDTPQKAERAIRSYWAERRGIRMLQFG